MIATVNGRDISKSEFEQYLADITRQSGREVPAEQRGQLLDQFIDMQLVAEAGEKAGITKEQAVEEQIAVARLKVIADAWARKYIEDHPVTDAELRPEYDAQVAALPSRISRPPHPRRGQGDCRRVDPGPEGRCGFREAGEAEVEGPFLQERAATSAGSRSTGW